MNEYKIQNGVMDWTNQNIKKYPELINLFPVKINEAAKNFILEIPNLFLASPHGAYSGLFLITDIEESEPTAKQIEVINNLIKQNYFVHVCYSADTAIEVITDYLRGKQWNQQELLNWISWKNINQVESTDFDWLENVNNKNK